MKNEELENLKREKDLLPGKIRSLDKKKEKLLRESKMVEHKIKALDLLDKLDKEIKLEPWKIWPGGTFQEGDLAAAIWEAETKRDVDWKAGRLLIGILQWQPHVQRWIEVSTQIVHEPLLISRLPNLGSGGGTIYKKEGV